MTSEAGLIQPQGEDLQHLGAIPRRNALRFSKRLAYACGSDEITWAAFEVLTDRLAHALRDHGIGHRDHVAVLGRNSIEFLAVEFSLFKLGATVVLTNLGLPAGVLARQLKHGDVKAVFTSDSDLRDRVESGRDLSEISLHFCWDREADPISGVTTLVELIERGERGLSGRFELHSVSADDTALVVFSSGTTGEPKGAVNSYRDVGVKLLVNALAQEFCQWEIGMVATQLCMGGTQLLSVLPYALLGMTTVLVPTFDAARVISEIETRGATSMFAVPTMIEDFISHPAFKQADLSSFDRIISAGAPLPEPLYQRVTALGIRQFELGGASETGGGLLITDAERALKPGSVGRPYVGYVIRVLRDDGTEAEADEIGEIVIGGDALSQGYYGRPDLTEASYRDGWFFTGDLGKRDSDGYFYYAGRAKDMVVTGGANVYPRDVEEVLLTAQGVRQATVLGLPHPRWGEAVTAFVVRDESFQGDEEELRAFCRDRLMPNQIPKAVVFVAALPQTVVGKVSKQELAAEYADLYSSPNSEGRSGPAHVA